MMLCLYTIHSLASIQPNNRKFAEQNGLDTSFDTRNATFTVIDSEEPNAFVLPGNHVFCK